MQTDQLIETYGPGREGNPDAAVTVAKISISDDRYLIAFSTDCANMFGCVPSEMEMKAAFNQFVSPAS